MSKNADRITSESKNALNKAKNATKSAGRTAGSVGRLAYNLKKGKPLVRILPVKVKIFIVAAFSFVLLASILVGGTGGIYSTENTHVYADGSSEFPFLGDMSAAEKKKDNSSREDALDAISKYTNIIHEAVEENHDEVDARIEDEIKANNWDREETMAALDDQSGYEQEGTHIPTGSATATTASVSSPLGEEIIKEARKYLGPHYVYGGEKLKDLKEKGSVNRIDCSAFTRAIYWKVTKREAKKGKIKGVKPIRLSRTAEDQKGNGVVIGHGKKDLGKAQPGDLLLYGKENNIHHVALFVGKKGKEYYELHATSQAGNQRDGVIESSLNLRDKNEPNYIVRVIDKPTKGSVSTKTREGKCWTALKLAGYSDECAAGIMGNIQQESGFNIAYDVASGKWAGTGLFNMTDGNAKNLKNYASKAGKNWKTSPAIQIEWMDRKHVPGCFKSYTGKSTLHYYGDYNTYTWWRQKVTAGEFKRINSSNWKKYKDNNDGQGKDTNAVDLCAHMWCNVVERAGIPKMSQRRKYARNWYEKFAGKMITSYDEDYTSDVTVEDLKILSAYSVSIGNLQLSTRVQKSKGGHRALETPMYDYYDENGNKMDLVVNSATGRVDFEKDIKNKLEKYKKKKIKRVSPKSFIKDSGYLWPVSSKKTSYDKSSKILEITCSKDDPVSSAAGSKIIKIMRNGDDTCNVTTRTSFKKNEIEYKGIVLKKNFKVGTKLKKGQEFATVPRTGKIKIATSKKDKKITSFFDVDFQKDSSGSTTFTKPVSIDLGVEGEEADAIEKVVTRTVRYGIPTVKMKDITEICLPMFGVEPEDSYVNSKGHTNADVIVQMTKNAIAIYFDGDPNNPDGKNVLIDGGVKSKYKWPAPENKKTKYDKSKKELTIFGNEGDAVVTIAKGTIEKITTKGDLSTVIVSHEKGAVRVTYQNVVLNEGIKEKQKLPAGQQFGTFPPKGKTKKSNIKIYLKYNKKKINPRTFIESGDNGTFIWPVPGHKTISSKYGDRDIKNESTNDNWHSGVDIPAPKGAKIVASRSGTVVAVFDCTYGSYGRLTIIKHDNGWHTFYAHQSKFLVKKGERVRQGQVIGKVGATGHADGTHLHFEIVIGPYKHYGPENRTDPEPYITKRIH